MLAAETDSCREMNRPVRLWCQGAVIWVVTARASWYGQQDRSNSPLGRSAR
jgi:hypothetical protein